MCTTYAGITPQDVIWNLPMCTIGWMLIGAYERNGKTIRTEDDDKKASAILDMMKERQDNGKDGRPKD